MSEYKIEENYFKRYRNKTVCCATCINGSFAQLHNNVRVGRCCRGNCLHPTKDHSPIVFPKGWKKYMKYSYLYWQPFHPVRLEGELFEL